MPQLHSAAIRQLGLEDFLKQKFTCKTNNTLTRLLADTNLIPNWLNTSSRSQRLQCQVIISTEGKSVTFNYMYMSDEQEISWYKC